MKEIDKYKVDTCAVQEIRQSRKGTAMKENSMIFFVGIRVTDINLEQDFISVDMLLTL